VTLTAQRVLGVDAAILFADLLPILEPMGFQLEYRQGDGPAILNPVRDSADVDRVRVLENVDDLGFVFDAVRLIRRDLPADIPLLGFAGCPFTLASYAIEGGGSRNYVHTKQLMYADAMAWNELMQRLSASLVRYLNAQISAGCQAVQVFDSWAGCLSPADYRKYVLPHTRAVIDGLPPEVPVINFLTGNPALLPLMREAGGQIIGLDWRVDLKDAWATVGHDVAIQGNLDPISLFADIPILRERTRAVIDAAEGRPGHIFNLGHGVLPDMDPNHVKALVEMVHEMGQR
jgi:uroporphyrinogen decarboxylase